MSAPDSRVSEAIDAYLHATLLLETIIPGSAVDTIDGARHIHYGRPIGGVWHEIVLRDAELAAGLTIVANHPEVAPAYLAIFTSLGNDPPDGDEAALSHVVRNTLMAFQLPDVAPFSDPSLRRVTDIEELRRLARIRDDAVLTVEHYTDEIGCYVLEIDDDPVSSALLIPSPHETAVIEHVLTLPAYRRRGYGRWLLRALHAEAARLGLRQAVLGSNAAGLPLYTALGYEPLCYVDICLTGQ
jgi:GNAT superfamily N-acetyltransferase